MATNMKDLLAMSLSKSWKQNQVISSLVWKTIVEEYKRIKNIDIHSFIISVKVHDTWIIIHTGKTILNTELYYFNEIFEQKIAQKLTLIGIEKKNLKLKFK